MPSKLSAREDSGIISSVTYIEPVSSKETVQPLPPSSPPPITTTTTTAAAATPSAATIALGEDEHSRSLSLTQSEVGKDSGGFISLRELNRNRLTQEG